MTVTGRTLGENLEQWTHKYGELDSQQDVIRPLDNPIKSSGHIRCVLYILSYIRYVRLHRSNTITDTLCFFSSVCFFFFDRILKGNLTPGGAVAKITGKEGLGFTGKARAFDTEDEFVKAVENGSIKKGEKTVVILRYLGPQGGPGEFV